MKHIVFLYVLFLFFSCTNNERIEIDTTGYLVDTLQIDPNYKSLQLDSTNYEITKCMELELPNDVSEISCDYIMQCNRRIYILDRNINKTVFVYDDSGSFLHRLGRLGHAKDEYLYAPTCFSVETCNDCVHVYESQSQRILVFNKDGKIERTINFSPYRPSRIIVTKSNKYLCAFEGLNEYNSDELALFNIDGEFVKSIVPSRKKRNITIDSNHFSISCSQVSYHPVLSHFAIIIEDDKLKKFIQFGFGREDKIADFSHGLDKSMQPSIEITGVTSISWVDNSNRFLHVAYVKNGLQYHYLYNKETKAYFNSEEPLLSGIWWESNYWMQDDELLFVTPPERLKKILRLKEHNPDIFAKVPSSVRRRVENSNQNLLFTAVMINK